MQSAKVREQINNWLDLDSKREHCHRSNVTSAWEYIKSKTQQKSIKNIHKKCHCIRDAFCVPLINEHLTLITYEYSPLNYKSCCEAVSEFQVARQVGDNILCTWFIHDLGSLTSTKFHRQPILWFLIFDLLTTTTKVKHCATWLVHCTDREIRNSAQSMYVRRVFDKKWCK